MTTSATLHEAAMELADAGDRHRRRGEHDAARASFRAALEREREAALAESTEPSRGILCRSASWLALEAEDPREAERLAAIGLTSAELPERVANELRAVMEDARVRLTGGLPPPSMVSSIGLVLEGAEVGYGEADPVEILTRVDRLSSVVYRTAERRAQQPFRRSGPPRSALRERVRPRLRIEPGSVLLRLVLGGAQQSMWDENAALVDDLVRCFAAIGRGDAAALRALIPDQDYRENLEALAAGLAPDGVRVSSVGLLGAAGGVGRAPVALGRPDGGSPQRVAAGARRMEGTLWGADRKRTAAGAVRQEIKVEQDDGGVEWVGVSDAVLEDIVRPLFGRRVRLDVVPGRGKVWRLIGTPEAADG